MTSLRVDQIGFGWGSHVSALWWLALLYRRPNRLRESLESLGGWRSIRAGAKLYAHAIPWVLFLMIVGRLVIHGGFGIQSKYAELDPLQAVLAHLKSLACAIAVGIIVGILSGIAFGVIRAVVLAIGFPIAKGSGLGIASGICAGICTGIAAHGRKHIHF